LVAYFTKNENPEQRFVKQREKQWKESHKNMLLTLAQLNLEATEKSKKKKNSNKRNVKSKLISSKFFIFYLDYVKYRRLLYCKSI